MTECQNTKSYYAKNLKLSIQPSLENVYIEVRKLKTIPCVITKE